LAIIGAWFEIRTETSVSQVDLVIYSLQNYALLFAIATVGIVAFTNSRVDDLQDLRTSTSTTLYESSGCTKFVTRAANLFDPKSPVEKEARLFEAPTIIRYEPGQVLAPHFDANRSAQTEDANRGGQTLATLIVYLNNVEKGGLTKFGRLSTTGSSIGIREEYISVKPKLGDALLLFPAKWHI